MMRAIKFTGTLALLLTLTGFVRAEETKGTIKTVDTGRHEVVLKGTIKDTIYELKKGANVWLDGAQSKLGELRADDAAFITFEKSGDHMMAIYVRALRNAKDATGTIRDVISQKNEVVLKGVVKDSTYELDKNATVWFDGKAMKLTDLREGDEVRITYQARGEHMVAAEVRVLKRK